jgi:hypothetical protein
MLPMCELQQTKNAAPLRRVKEGFQNFDARAMGCQAKEAWRSLPRAELRLIEGTMREMLVGEANE